MKTIILITTLILAGFNTQNNSPLLINQILSNPEKYNNKTVTVYCYYVSEFENNSLWNNKKERKSNNFNKSIWLNNINKNAILLDKEGNKKELYYFRNKYIIITGTLKSKPEKIDNFTIGYGHMNIWPAEIQNIQKIEEIIHEKSTTIKTSSIQKLSKCQFETYVEYKDSLPIYNKPNGQIIKHFRFEDNPDYDFGGGFLFKNSEIGWLQIGHDTNNPQLENYWIKSDFIKVGTTNYNGEKISLHEKATKESKVTGFILEESIVNVLECNNDWVLIEKDNKKGWLSPEYICNNPETNCN